MPRLTTALTLAVLLAAGPPAAARQTDEEVAQRQLESGRAFARQGNYPEALTDFRAVAETHATTSVADDALLEIARYYLDVEENLEEASAAVDAILRGYATSDSAPDAYVMAGRLALARSHATEDLDAALANFDRVVRLFPDSPAVPDALLLAADAHWYAGRPADALANLMNVMASFAGGPAAAEARLRAARSLVAVGQPVRAMEGLQQVRNLWPGTEVAGRAIGEITRLYRLYLRARSGPAFVFAESIGPARLRDVVGLAATGEAIVWATESGLGSTAGGAAAPPGTRPSGIALDTDGRVVVVEGSSLRLPDGNRLAAVARQANGNLQALDDIRGLAQLSNGDWLVADNGERAIQRFTRDGTYAGPFAPVRVTRLAASSTDTVAGFDRDDRSVALFDGAGRRTGRIPLRSSDYNLENPADLAFDSFGHLFVLDREAVAVFSPYPAEPTTEATAGDAPPTWRLISLFTARGEAAGAFDRAQFLALDDTGALYLYNQRTERIQVYR